jgi:hypothetical protein
MDTAMPVDVYVEYYMEFFDFKRYKNRAATIEYLKARHKAMNDWTKDSRTECNQAFMKTELPDAIRRREDKFNKLYKKTG